MSTLRNPTDAYVAESQPARNFSKTRRLYVGATSGNIRYAYTYWGLPSGLAGSNVTSAVVRLRTGGSGFSGSVTLTMRRLGQKFSVNRVNWDNKPTTTGAAVAVTKTSHSEDQLWEFDVTTQLQAVADGAPWFGFRIEADGTGAKYIHSAEADESLRPVLVVTFSDDPEPPENLKPDDGKAVSLARPVLRWEFDDIASYQLRLFSSEADAIANGSAILDHSGTTNDPSCDLSTTAYGGTADGAQVWWRVRATNTDGRTSDWSEPATWVRNVKGALTISNPSSGSPVVNEPTPPFIWSLSGETQESYEVILALASAPETVLWTSGQITSTDNSVTPAEGIISSLTDTYRVVVRVWDTVDRVSTPGDPAYVEVTRDFTFAPSSSVATVDGLIATPSTIRPRMTLDWSRTTAPDGFVIFRDGEVVKELDAADALVSGSQYQYIDRKAPPRREHTWSVGAKVNGVVSSDNPTVTGLVKSVTTVLSDPDSDREVFLFNAQPSIGRGENSSVQYLLGDAAPVLITQSIRGYEGSLNGVLVSDVIPDLTADIQLDNFNWFRRRQGKVLLLSWVGKAFNVVCWNMSDNPIPRPDGTTEYLVSFDFVEVD